QAGHAFLLKEVAGVIILRLRNRDGGDTAAVFLRRVQAHATPAAADFQEMFAWLELEFLAEAVVLGYLRFFKALTRLVKQSAGIGHGRVQEETVKFVAQV